MVDLRPDGSGRAAFVFANDPGIGADAQAFLEDAPVPVRSLGRAVARLRSRCRELRRGQMEGNERAHAARVSP